MRPVALALAVLIALAVTASAAAQETPADVPLVRMRDGHGSDLLFRLNPRTLQQVGRPIRTFTGGTDLSVSPDGSRLAFASPWRRGSRRGARRGPRRGARIHFVDIAGWRSMGVAEVGRQDWLTVGWLSPDRLLAVANERARQRLLWVDARTRKVVARGAYSGWTVNSLTVPGGLAVVLGPQKGVGPIRVLLVDENGGIRRIVLDGIEAGADYAEPSGRVLTPAVTVDRETGHLYVVAARGLLVAEVDLASGAVEYHSLGASASKGNIGVWWRHAVWAGDGRIAVTGTTWPLARGRRVAIAPVPFGIRMIDTGSWTIATFDARPDTMHVAADTVLATGTRFFPAARRSESTGLLAFDDTGRRAYTRFRGRQVVLLGSRGKLGYVWVRPTRTAHVIDMADGRTLNTIRTGRVPSLLSPGS
ncbi:MAG: hypothetical protein ACXWWO_07365 [Candidatus Limnocylindria bacterium]